MIDTRDASLGQRLLQDIEVLLRRREVGPLLGLAIMVAVFSLMSSNLLFSGPEINGITALTASIGTVAVGVAFLMVSGEFDLSVGAVFAIAAVIFGQLLNDHHFAPWQAFLTVLAISAGIGLVNGLVTIGFGIPSFIVTLASLFVIQGVDLVITGGNTILYFGGSKFVDALGGTIPGTTIQYRALWYIALTLVLWFVLERTPYGNWTAAAGGRAGVARAMGVRTSRVKIVNFMVCSMTAALAGIMQFAAYGAASANDGQDYNLYAIVAAVIGGTSLFGVTGTIIGAFIGALILGTLQSGLILVGVPGSWYTPMIGVILVVAVIVNVRLNNLNLRTAFSRFTLVPNRPAHGPTVRDGDGD
jgi:simple sugar transport system permease protein